MLKRLPILCFAVFALAACSQGHDSSAAPSATPAPATTATTTPAPAPAAPTTVAGTAAAASASTTAAVPAATGTDAGAGTGSTDAAAFVEDPKWVEGKNYFRIDPAQPKVTNTDKIEVTEVFSYACPSCNNFHPLVNKLATSLPSNAVMAYLPVSFMPQENFPMFQRAYLTAQALGVAEKANDAIYDAVWKSRELSSMRADQQGLKPMSDLPTIEDAAKVYAKFGVDPKEFVAVANSFSINTQVKRSNELVKAYGVEGTPTIVIDGKYRFDGPSAGGYAQMVELAQYLVAKEAAGK
ncbi:thiol:disulfide interchange protein DsbA/DsbL [Dyella sp.]|jgi:thiol:disulfide interchange protein DsbA|uniref:thiol:disulfide interchange protein DsbA/DsbL n=1 Tax=Dyella sp. TaxID=1869338 RepID=UPI002D7814DA|nr:thiol:disulfide interchange protein DsbA/DsbL [Dyella sp.]HET6431919.1 thiol:disulfide interchange protein DsbA/DsbL [Dyella sp.]